MSLKSILTHVLALYTVVTFCQKENSNWHFGGSTGISFEDGTPQTITVSSSYVIEGTASISDQFTGEILFYTDADSVWNRNNVGMANSGKINGMPATAGSSTQAALILKKPSSDSLYYIFTAAENAHNAGLQLATVDMSLNGGLGDVIAKNVSLYDGPVTEKLTAVYKCNGIDIWIIAHDYQTDSFIIIEATSAGVSYHSSIAVGSVHSNVRGYMKAFCDPNIGCKIATIKQDGSGAELFNFNSSTGNITSWGSLNPPGFSGYGLAFSPDHSKLYLSGTNATNMTVLQYDLTAGFGNIDSVKNSVYTADSRPKIVGGYASMSVAYDSMIYVGRHSKDTLARIEAPNSPKASCNFNFNGYALNAGLPPGYGQAFYGLTNNFDGYNYFDLSLDINHSCDLTDSITIELTSPPYYDNYDVMYSDGGNANLNFSNSFIDSHLFTDTSDSYVTIIAIDQFGCNRILKQKLLHNPLDTIPSTYQICEDSSINITGPDADNYLWLSTNDTQQTIAINESGQYSLVISNTCYADTLTIRVDKMDNTLELQNWTDSIICLDSTIDIISNNHGNNISYLWSNGSTSTSISVSSEGTYSLITRLDTSGCTYTLNETYNVNTIDCNSEQIEDSFYIYIPNIFSASSKDNNTFRPRFTGVKKLMISIYSQSGQKIYVSNDLDRYWNGTYRDQYVNNGVYTYVIDILDNQQSALQYIGNVTFFR